MSPKILRRCDICGKFHVAYIVEDARLGKLYLCQSCWHSRVTAQTQPEKQKSPENPGDKEKPEN